MQVTDLLGNPVDSVTEGEKYLVPCVFGIPVICPSHVDEGTSGPTARHWHTDDRFGYTGRSGEFWHESTWDYFNTVAGDTIRSDTLKDEGQPIVMEEKTATKNVITPSGGVWSSLVWLYLNVGHLSSVDKHCVHHRTPLVKQDGCLTCPAHGLKFKLDGSPRYKSPFYVATRYIDWENNIHQARAEAFMGRDSVRLHISGKFDVFPEIRLEDSTGEVIFKCNAKTRVKQPTQGGTSSLTLSIGAWPKTDLGCPRLVSQDPR